MSLIGNMGMDVIDSFELCEFDSSQHNGPARYLLTAAGQLPARSDGTLVLLAQPFGEGVTEPALVGIANGDQPVYLQVVDTPPELEDIEWMAPRAVLPGLSAAGYMAVSRALQLGVWARDHAFCGVCGGRNVLHANERAMHCESCNRFYFPRINPCVITIVTRGDYCLLAHHTRYATDFYSTLAGFIEAGETIEEAVHREIFEEVGIRVKNLNYFGSQSWPFPGQLMVGFTAEHAEGDINIDGVEIDDARWFHFDDLPKVPGVVSISGQLIQDFVESRRSMK